MRPCIRIVLLSRMSWLSLLGSTLGSWKRDGTLRFQSHGPVDLLHGHLNQIHAPHIAAGRRGSSMCCHWVRCRRDNTCDVLPALRGEEEPRLRAARFLLLPRVFERTCDLGFWLFAAWIWTYWSINAEDLAQVDEKATALLRRLIYVPISFYKMRGLSRTIKCFI